MIFLLVHLKVAGTNLGETVYLIRDSKRVYAKTGKIYEVLNTNRFLINFTGVSLLLIK